MLESGRAPNICRILSHSQILSHEFSNYFAPSTTTSHRLHSLYLVVSSCFTFHYAAKLFKVEPKVCGLSKKMQNLTENSASNYTVAKSPNTVWSESTKLGGHENKKHSFAVPSSNIFLDPPFSLSKTQANPLLLPASPPSPWRPVP
jgi:hypothetical protein